MSSGGTYAKRTDVSQERTIGEIERTLRRYGAHAFAYGYEHNNAVVGFKMLNRSVRFTLHMPQPIEFARTPTGLRRTDRQMQEHHRQAVRQRWRALLLIIKAKLEAVQAGIVEFDQEFLAHLVLPTGETVGEAINVDEAISRGELPPLVPQRALTTGGQ